MTLQMSNIFSGVILVIKLKKTFCWCSECKRASYWTRVSVSINLLFSPGRHFCVPNF